MLSQGAVISWMSISNKSKQNLWYHNKMVLVVSEEYKPKNIVQSQFNEIIIIIYIIASHETFHTELLTLYTGKHNSKILIFICNMLYHIHLFFCLFSSRPYNTTTVWSLLHKSLNTAMDITQKQFTIPVAVLLKIPMNLLPLIDYKSVGCLNNEMWVTTAFQIWIYLLY